MASTKIKAVKKEQKLYLWDWGMINDRAARFENLIALHLLRLVDYLRDVKGMKAELRFFRDLRGHEVDFVILVKSKAWLAVEVKSSAQALDPNLKYLLERVKIPRAFQVHIDGKSDKRLEDINGAQVFMMPASKFLKALP